MNIFDIDGTLTAEFFTNWNVRHLKPNIDILNIALSSQRNNPNGVLVVTARPENLRQDTVFWLDKYGLNPEMLLMRENEDLRPDFHVRVDQVGFLKELYGRDLILYDDKKTNCEMVMEVHGIPYVHIRTHLNEYREEGKKRINESNVSVNRQSGFRNR